MSQKLPHRNVEIGLSANDGKVRLSTAHVAVLLHMIWAEKLAKGMHWLVKFIKITDETPAVCDSNRQV